MAEEPIVTPQNDAGGTEPEKTFTQEEVDAMIARRVAREKKGMPSAEELEKFRNWQKEQQTEGERIASVTKERDEASNALKAAQQENWLLRNGVPAEDVDYYAFKIGKLVTDKKDFETAAKEYLKEKPPVSAAKVELGAKANGSGGGTNMNDTMNRLIRGAHQ